MKTLEPKEGFLVKVHKGNIAPDYHLESSDGKNWIKKSGQVRMRVYYDDVIHDEIDKVVKPIRERAPENSILRLRISKLQHKLYGIKFHLDNFKHNEDNLIAKFNEDYEGPDHEYVVTKPEIIYEVESFLFQIKSCLDILAQIIGIAYRFTTPTYSDNGDKLIKLLQQNTNNVLKDNAAKLAKIIEFHKKWVSDVIDMRDEVTHFSDLEGFLSFVHYPWNGGETAKIGYPCMPDGTRARKYLETIYQELLKLIQEIGPYLTITK